MEHLNKIQKINRLIQDFQLRIKNIENNVNQNNIKDELYLFMFRMNRCLIE